MTVTSYGGDVQTIRPLTADDVDTVVAFAVEAWAPVFASLETEMGSEVYGAIYPDWRASQAAAVESVCTEPDNDVWIAVVDDRPVGFVAVCITVEDAAQVGEIIMVAVDPAHQHGGVASSLVQHALDKIEAVDVDLAVVATGGDPGHAPARALYEKFGFSPLRQVRYYRKVGDA
jgi:ribosomal protein S18 acetylase RimI-like enzyme